MIHTPHQYYLCDKIKEDEMGKACGKHGREDRHTGLGTKTENMRPLGRPRFRCEYSNRS